MNRVTGRILSAFMMAVWWLLVGAKGVLDAIGYSTAPEDIEVVQTRLDQFIGWLLTVPWWVLLGIAFASTVFLIWVSWPRQQSAVESNRKEESPVAIKPTNALDSPTTARLPTAAELIDEQERREALGIMEGLLRSANSASKLLETVITQIAALSSSDDQPEARALRFFVRESVFHIYLQSCDSAVRNAEEAIQNKWLEQLCHSVGELVTEYWKAQRYLGILVNHTRADLLAAADYQVWRASEEEYVRRFRAAASQPRLRKTLPSTLPIVQTFEERGLATMKV